MNHEVSRGEAPLQPDQSHDQSPSEGIPLPGKLHGWFFISGQTEGGAGCLSRAPGKGEVRGCCGKGEAAILWLTFRFLKTHMSSGETCRPYPPHREHEEGGKEIFTEHMEHQSKGRRKRC